MDLYSSDGLAALDAAILQAAQGKTVTFGDRSWTAQDLPALRELRADVAAVVARTAGTGASHRLAATRKGV